ncbi:manganese peroxidase [Sistotremastrum niveocremeum HHB9708]|uniref:Peroxidase n=2 Tax=Sistotremastraceae TaxID=3402574 RepID=A0A164VJR6_9AGAM|nr:manganese peroxidase [Sistotremastrum niveocremeum HHB9708]KZT39996.1 manganese peroxidase isozyme 3 [Sistotremastrum suecicum HHB10207 ss-3]
MFAKSLFALATLAVAASAANFKRVACPSGHTASHAACCAFEALRDDLQANLFGGVCGEEAHESLRLAFHDAIGFSKKLGPSAGGGADGSALAFPDVEPNFPANLGIADSVDFLTPFGAAHNVSAGDLIQFAAAVGITNCPGAPRLGFLAGRPPPKAPSIIGLVPEPQDNVTSILERMEDGGGFSPAEVIALLSSHSIARSDHVDPTIGAVPFDSTPFVYDTQVFLEVLLKGTGFPGTGPNQGEVQSPLPLSSGQNVGELRLQSDFALARDARTACTWQGFINEQSLMASRFQAAMAKLAVIGQNTRELVDCSDVIPAALPAVKKPATFPAGTSEKDVERSCFATPFPTLSADRGPATLIPHCPPSQGGDADDCDSDEGSL